MQLRTYALICAGALALLLAACTPSSDSDGVIHVPAEAKTLTEAEERARPGDMILIAPGTYHEQLLVSTPDITIRGEDRNSVIIDGEDTRSFGIVVTADGVRVENLTTQNSTFYGVLFTGLHDEQGPSAPTVDGYERWDPEAFPPLQRFLVDHVTATNNGLYGIYAFNAQHGAILNSYASGSADSGIYVGQCRDCDILVAGNVAERSAVGFENANASDSVMIINNRFSDNRVGLTLLSNYQEAFVPQARNVVVGNVVTNNQNASTPAQVAGGFGIGVGISGGIENFVERNLIIGNDRAGVLINNAEDLPALDNTFIDNVFTGNRVDVVNSSADRAPAAGNCVVGKATAEPADLVTMLVCGTEGTQPAVTELAGPEVPPGTSYRQVAPPRDQPNLPPREHYDRLPDAVDMPDPASIDVPPADLFADRAGAR